MFMIPYSRWRTKWAKKKLVEELVLEFDPGLKDKERTDYVALHVESRVRSNYFSFVLFCFLLKLSLEVQR